MRAVLYPLLKHGPAKRMADAVADLNGDDTMDYLIRRLDLRLDVAGLDHIPEQGRVLIACTHPTGIADGIALYGAVKQRRPDQIYFANRDAVRAAPGLARGDHSRGVGRGKAQPRAVPPDLARHPEKLSRKKNASCFFRQAASPT